MNRSRVEVLTAALRLTLIPIQCQDSFGFEVPSVLLKKNGKTRDVFSCVKFMFITCDKKINIVDILIYAL